jgi:D-amino-acid oxidase
MGAGGLWMPFHCDDERTDRWAFDTLDELMSYVGSGSTGAAGDGTAKKSLVEILPAISLKQCRPDPPGWATDPRSRGLNFQTLTIDDLYKESELQNFRLPDRELIGEAGYSYGWLFHPPVVDSPTMLEVSIIM